MNEQMQSRMDEYVQAFDALKGQVGNESVAVVLFQEMGKDRRCAQLEARQSKGYGSNGANGDAPASSKQVNYLKRLGVKTAADLTRAEASKLIDEALANTDTD